MVVDTSAVIALLFEEPAAPWIQEQLDAHAGMLTMSTINLAEAIIVLRSRLSEGSERLEASLLSKPIRFVPPDVQHAKAAAEARLKYPLNFGDCFAYALSVAEDAPILTLDQDFRLCDRPCLIFGPR